jgi:hypothetical protein
MITTAPLHQIKTCFVCSHVHVCRFDLIRFIVFNATFNNISAISWRSVLLVEETGIPGEIYRPVTVTDQGRIQDFKLGGCT